jgi:hypothetical protein
MPQDLISQIQSIVNSILGVLQIIATFLIAFLVVLWLTLCLWTFRDIQARTRDIVAQVFATLLVVFFNIPGVLLYILVRPKVTLTQEYEAQLQEEYMLQDLEEREVCPTCRVKTQPDFLYCYNCRTKLRRDCPGCGQVIKLKWTNCPYCGLGQKPPSREATLDRLGLSTGNPTATRRPASTAIVPDDYGKGTPATGTGRQSAAARFKAPTLRAGYADGGFDENQTLENEAAYHEVEEYNPPIGEDSPHIQPTQSNFNTFKPRPPRPKDEGQP